MFGCVVAQKLLQGDDVDFRSMTKDILQRVATCYSKV